jgi:uncharacterized protein (TIGR03435 family)
MAKCISLVLSQLFLAGLFALPPSAPAQTELLHASGPLPSFEVTTVKPKDPNVMVMITPPSSQIVVRNAGTARQLIARAYNVSSTQRDRVLGGPDWLDDSKVAYVIEGKIPDDVYSQMQKMTADERTHLAMLMMQSLLADRFKLKAHVETREMPVYELTIARDGPKLPPPNDTKPPAATPGSADPPRAPQMGGGEILTKDGIRIRNLTLDGMLAPPWFGLGGRPIVNKTGLTGTYNLTLNFVPDVPGQSGPNAPLVAPEGQASIFTALQEQLGLKLTAAKAPVEVLVIDSIEKPSEN